MGEYNQDQHEPELLSAEISRALEKAGIPYVTREIHFTNNDAYEYIAWLQKVEEDSRKHPLMLD